LAFNFNVCRYAAVRKTGGLADTVFDVDDASVAEEKKNGFAFEGADHASLVGLYKLNPVGCAS
jgi:glycogen synthase